MENTHRLFNKTGTSPAQTRTRAAAVRPSGGDGRHHLPAPEAVANVLFIRSFPLLPSLSGAPTARIITRKNIRFVLRRRSRGPRLP